jgi:mRNA-degrading endonuclease RelE of RelBE toxin-antitoxin system
MTWQVKQTRRFARSYKKLHPNIAVAVDQAVAAVAHNPHIGDQKKGDLASLRVHKFNHLGQLWLLGYTLEEEVRLVYLEAIGSHQNFYRDLKK